MVFNWNNQNNDTHFWLEYRRPPGGGPEDFVDRSAKPSSSSVSSSLSSTSGDAAFAESFLFHVPPTKLDRAHIVIEMFDHSPAGPVSVGHCVIGRLGHGPGHAHWTQMVRKHGLPVCMWHRIHGGSVD